MVFSRRSMGSAKNTQTRQVRTPAARQMSREEWLVCSTSSSLPMPSPRATDTLTPPPRPMSRPVNRETRVVVEPTEPRAI